MDDIVLTDLFIILSLFLIFTVFTSFEYLTLLTDMYSILKVLLVTGGLMKSPDPSDNTEIYQNNAWKTASELPFSRLVWGVSAVTFNNRALVFGNDKNCTYKKSDLKYPSGGHTTSDLNKIFEFNKENETWSEIGSMKETRRHNRVAIVPYSDFAKWCNPGTIKLGHLQSPKFIQTFWL